MPVRRGEIYWIDWDPSRGSEQSGRRPGLVVSNDIANEHAPVVIVASLTTRQPTRPYPFLVAISALETGMTRDGIVNCLQLMTIAKDRMVGGPGSGGRGTSGARPAGRLSGERMVEVDRALKAALALN